jgi:uncharacterized protein HemX
MPQDRQTKLDTTIGSASPEAMERTRQEVDAARMRLDEHDQSVFIEPSDLISEPPSPPPLPGEKERLDKLALIQDMQLILVDKYRKGAKLLWVALVLLAIGIVGVGVLIWKNNDLQAHIRAFQEEQRQFKDSQTKIAESQTKIEQKTEATKDAIEETQKKVDAAVEATPKIEVDAQGRPTKIVVPTATTSLSSKPPRSNFPAIPAIPIEPRKK